VKNRPSIDPAIAKRITITHDEGRAGVIAQHGPAGPYILVTHLMPTLLAVHFADGPHPMTGAPDFRPDRPHAIVAADQLATSDIWQHLESKPEHAAALSAALGRARPAEWPS
jgi:hypothetical protein